MRVRCLLSRIRIVARDKIRYASSGMKHHLQILTVIGVLPLAGLIVFVWLLMPRASYVHTQDASSAITYVHVYPQSVTKVTIDPGCRREVTEAEPSPGFGSAYKYCEKRSYSIMEIESRQADSDQEILTLKYAEAGEKGDSYRETLTLNDGEALYNGAVYTATSKFSILRYITR